MKEITEIAEHFVNLRVEGLMGDTENLIASPLNRNLGILNLLIIMPVIDINSQCQNLCKLLISDTEKNLGDL